MDTIARDINVKAIWDPDASVWVATSDDVPGLVAEAETSEALIQKLRVLIPELLELNGLLDTLDPPEIPFQLLSERSEVIAV